MKITYSPIKEIVIHDIAKVDFRELIQSRITPQGNLPLYWCNGIIFGFASMPFNDQLVADYLNGILHWMEVQYTYMENFSPELSIDDTQYTKVMVINTSNNALHKEFIEWLKKIEQGNISYTDVPSSNSAMSSMLENISLAKKQQQTQAASRKASKKEAKKKSLKDKLFKR
ncbi:MAG: hypothetical protein ACP5RP_00250 [Candidatus Micrarchaeia archaeon]